MTIQLATARIKGTDREGVGGDPSTKGWVQIAMSQKPVLAFCIYVVWALSGEGGS